MLVILSFNGANVMNVVREVEKVIAIQDTQKKLNSVIGPLEQLFERGRALQLQPAKLGKAASLLLTAALEEQQAELKEEMFAVLLTAVSWNGISRYMDWISLVEHLPQLSGYCLGYALAMLGWSRRYVFLPVLQEYLDGPDLFIQLEALAAMKQLWWDASGHDLALKKCMQPAVLTELESILARSSHYAASNQALRERFERIRGEVVPNMQEWFWVHKHYQF